MTTNTSWAAGEMWHFASVYPEERASQLRSQRKFWCADSMYWRIVSYRMWTKRVLDGKHWWTSRRMSALRAFQVGLYRRRFIEDLALEYGLKLGRHKLRRPAGGPVVATYP